MKRIFAVCLCALTLLSLLTACGIRLPDPDALEKGLDSLEKDLDSLEDRLEDLERLEEGDKNHQYQILDAQETVLYTVTDEAQVEALDELLSDPGENADLEEAPEDEIACVYVFRQEKTLLAGQDPEAPRDYEALIRFTVYQNQDVITMRVLEGLGDGEAAGLSLADLLTFTVSVPAETMEALRDPGRFADP